MTLHHFPQMAHTYKQTRTGLGDIVAVTPGQSYTVDLVKNGGTAQILWNDQLGTSNLDSGWSVLTDLDTIDEAGVIPPDTATALMVSVTLPATGVDVSLTVTASKSKAMHSRAHANSGRSGGVSGGFSQDEYAALITADMGLTAGSFWSAQGGDVVTVADTGPSGINLVDAGGGVTLAAGPWPGSESMQSSGAGEFTNASWSLHGADGEEFAFEIWAKWDSIGAVNLMECGVGSIVGLKSSGVAGNTNDNSFQFEALTVVGDDLADPGAWAVSTAYSVGDRRRSVVDNGRAAECETAGTSGTCEPTWPTDGTTVADGGVVWRDLGGRTSFHDFNLDSGSVADGRTRELDAPANSNAGDRWYHLVAQRTSTAMELYVDGQLVDQRVYSAQTGQGGTPPRHEFATTSFEGTRIVVGSGAGGSNSLNGAWAYAAHYHRSLTAAEVLAHYDKGVELGVNT
jgi:hypothetical protein